MNTAEKIVEVYNKSGKFTFPRFAPRIQFFLTLLILIPSWSYVINSFPESDSQQFILIRIGLLCYTLALYFVLGDLLKYIINKRNLKKRELAWSQCLEQKVIPTVKDAAEELRYFTFFTECINLLECANAANYKSVRKTFLLQIELLGLNFDGENYTK